MIGSQWEILLQVFQLGAGRRVLIFPTQLVNLVVVCGLNSEREFYSPSGD
nr:MAG TPA: hypothetical protein [Caudoviricetes sp.]